MGSTLGLTTREARRTAGLLSGASGFATRDKTVGYLPGGSHAPERHSTCPGPSRRQGPPRPRRASLGLGPRGGCTARRSTGFSRPATARTPARTTTVHAAPNTKRRSRRQDGGRSVNVSVITRAWWARRRMPRPGERRCYRRRCRRTRAPRRHEDAVARVPAPDRHLPRPRGPAALIAAPRAPRGAATTPARASCTRSGAAGRRPAPSAPSAPRCPPGRSPRTSRRPDSARVLAPWNVSLATGCRTCSHGREPQTRRSHLTKALSPIPGAGSHSHSRC